MAGDQNMETEFALIKQQVQNHNRWLETLSENYSKVTESIHDISLTLQAQLNTKETLERVFNQSSEIKNELKDIRDDIELIKIKQPINDLCWFIVKCGCAFTLMAVLGGLIGMVVIK